jgi:alpha-beta hydrolase superfamily lysophospholipase
MGTSGSMGSMFARCIRWLGRRWLSVLTFAGVAAVISAAGCGQLAQKERELVFRIEPGTARWFGGLPAGVEEFNIPVPSRDGASLHAWWWPALASPREAPAVLYLHGSRWNLTGHTSRIAQLREFGFSVLAIDYRGFGQSKGELPSEASVYEDAQVAWERLVELQPRGGSRFIYGHSLGGAVAIDLAQKLSAKARMTGAAVPARGLIVESSFTSLADAAAAVTQSILPIGWLLRQKFDSLEKIGAVDMPVLLVHGTEDRYIPSRFSEELYAAAAQPKKLLLIEGGTHNSSMRAGKREYRAALGLLFGLDGQEGARDTAGAKDAALR